MKLNHIVLTINTIVLCLLLALFLKKEYAPEEQKKAYIVNQQVYEAFNARTHLQKKLEALNRSNQQKLDSLKTQMEKNQDDELLGQAYHLTQAELDQQEKTVAAQYEIDIWKQINQYVGQFGDENGYAFIFGATGDGNLMYANNAKNITEEVIKYINDRYEGKN